MPMSIIEEAKGFAMLAVAGIFLLNDNVIILVLGVMLLLYGASLIIGINPMRLLSYTPIHSQGEKNEEGEEKTIGFKHNVERDQNEEAESTKGLSIDFNSI